MRLVTWNWNGGQKSEAAAGLRGDVCTFQEVPEDVAGATGLRWFGDRSSRGLTVSAAPGFRVSDPVTDGLPRHVIPLEIEGPVSFQLISVWTQNDGRERYVRGLVRAVDVLSERIASAPTVIMGDFNANAQWDGDYPRDENYTALVERLSDLGLVSAYHTFFGEEPGGESRPTFFMYRHRHRPYHIDYCFIPREWLPNVRAVSVGQPDEWFQWSDHMPLTVDVDL